MRKVLFWAHLVLGIAAGIIVLIMSVTGVLLGFERQVVAWADRMANRPVSAQGQQPVSIEKLLSGLGDKPASVTLRNDPKAPVEASFGRERTVFLDPYDGTTLGEGSKTTHEFFASVVAVHRWLATTGSARASGRAVTGACNLLFLFLVFTGPFLWLPSKWRWRNVRAALFFRSGLTGKARDWNWHNVAGIWTFIPLAFIVASGVVMSYGWASDLLYRVTGTEVPAREVRASGGPPDRNGGPRGGRGRADQWNGVDLLVAVAMQKSPAWRSIGVRPAGENVAFTIDEGTGGQPQKRGQLLLQRATGSVVGWEPFSSNNAGRQLRMWSRFVHTGEAGGAIGQVVATVASAAAVLMVWTGFALTWRRFRASRVRQPSRSAIAA